MLAVVDGDEEIPAFRDLLVAASLKRGGRNPRFPAP